MPRAEYAAKIAFILDEVDRAAPTTPDAASVAADFVSACFTQSLTRLIAFHASAASIAGLSDGSPGSGSLGEDIPEE